jgi:hypothetical protein
MAAFRGGMKSYVAIAPKHGVEYFASLERDYGGKPLSRADFNEECVAQGIERSEEQKEYVVYLEKYPVKYWVLVTFTHWTGIKPGVNLFWRDYPDVSTKFSLFI